MLLVSNINNDNIILAFSKFIWYLVFSNLLMASNNLIKRSDNMQNKEIRTAIRKSGLYNWQVASMIPLSDGNFSKWLRLEMDEDKKAQVFAAIKKAKATYLNEKS